MVKKYTEEQIIAVLREGEAGAKVADLCRKYGMSDATYYNWKAKYAGLTVSELKRLKALGGKPAFKADCGGAGPGYPGAQGITLKKLLKPKAKRLAVSHARESLGLSERKACLLVNISASVYLYRPKSDNDVALRQRLRELAGERKRFGSPRCRFSGYMTTHSQVNVPPCFSG